MTRSESHEAKPKSQESVRLYLSRIASPIGEILTVAETRPDGFSALAALDFVDYIERMQRLLARRFPIFELVEGADPLGMAGRLARYFDGEGDAAFDDLDLSTGGTAFQQRVWAALRTIPPGLTWSYGALAAAIDLPTGSRAVGHANSLNPVAIVVPCHRVVGSKSTLTGYAGGIERKRWLLDHERKASGARLL